MWWPWLKMCKRALMKTLPRNGEEVAQAARALIWMILRHKFSKCAIWVALRICCLKCRGNWDAVQTNPPRERRKGDGSCGSHHQFYDAERTCKSCLIKASRKTHRGRFGYNGSGSKQNVETVWAVATDDEDVQRSSNMAKLMRMAKGMKGIFPNMK